MGGSSRCLGAGVPIMRVGSVRSGLSKDLYILGLIGIGFKRISGSAAMISSPSCVTAEIGGMSGPGLYSPGAAVDREEKRLPGQDPSPQIAGGKCYASNRMLKKSVQISCGSESRRLHR